MDLKELKSFIYVVDNENITLAAKKLFMTQPAISTHIKLLEKELDEKLLKKESKKVVPTNKGMELYEYAKKMLLLESELHKNLKNPTEILKIGVSSVPSLLCLPEILGAYKNTHKNINYQIYQGDSKKVVNDLQNDIIDVGLIGMDIKDKNILCEAFYKDTMAFIIPNTTEYKNLLKKKNSQLLNVLMSKPFIMREDGSGSKKNIIKFLEKLNVDVNDLNVIAEINSQDTILKLVESGIGISIVSKKVASDNKNKKIISYEVPDIKNERNLNIIYKVNKSKKHIKDFIILTKNFYKK